MRKLLAVFCALWLAGCATIMKGDLEDFEVETRPAGAKATMGEHTCHTPCNLDVERLKDYTLVIEKPGYTPLKYPIKGNSFDPWIWGNIVFLIGAPIGVAVDFYTGKAYDLSPSEIDVDLKPEKAPDQ